MNVPLKVAIIERGFRQADLARLLGLDAGRISRIVCGWVEPNQSIKNEISRHLGKSVQELFPAIGRGKK